MLTKSNPPRKPTHRIYAVTRSDKSEKGFWQTIGAAWQHGDGKGFSLKLDFLPMGPADIVIREIDEAAEAERRNARNGAPAAFDGGSDPLEGFGK